MKIDSRKFAPAPRLAERPQPPPAAASNTGMVPASKRPSDVFQTATPRPTTAATGNTGVTGTGRPAGPSKLNLDFKLDPSLEPYRGVFAKVGSKIAKLPEDKRAAAIDKSAFRLSKALGQPLDIVKDGVGNALQAALRAGPTTTRDPQECFYRSDRMLNFSPGIQAVSSQLKNLGLSLSKDSSLKSKGQILGAAKPQLDQLNLQGRDLKMAQRYLNSLVREDRARVSGSAFQGAQLPRVNSGTFQFLPRHER